MSLRPLSSLSVLALLLVTGCRSSAPSAPQETEAAPAAEASGEAVAAVDEEEAPEAEPDEVDAPIPEDAVAAVGSHSVLSATELDARLAEIVERYEALPGREPTTARWRNQRRRRIVQEAVHDYLVADFVAQQQVEVTDEEVDAAIRADLEYVYDDERLFERFLQSQHTTREDYLAQRRADLVEARVLATRGSLEPGDEELEAFYNDNRDRWHEDDRALVSEITIRLRSDAPEDQTNAALERINAARTRIAAGEAFADVAREVSESGDAARGGDMGWVIRGRRQQLAEDGVEDLVFSAELDQLSEPVRTQLGWQLFLVHDRREAGVRDLDEVRDIIYEPLARRIRDRLRRELVNELMETTEVQYFEDRWSLEEE